MLKIGNIELTLPVIAAPLSGYTDTAMRMINRQFGCELTFGGLMLDKSTAYRKVLQKPEYQVIEQDHPVGGQICGTDPEVMANAAAALVDHGYDLVDLNFACPVAKVVRRGRGGAMMKEPALAKAIIDKVRSRIACPLSLKIRRGYDDSPESRLAFWQICEAAVKGGVDAIFIHGRTTLQLYGGQSDWNILREVREKYPQAVLIGSGDLMTAENIVQRLAESGFDGVIAARGMIGNPWIFSETRALLNGQPLPAQPTIMEQYNIIRSHLEMILQHSPAPSGVRYFRKFITKYARRHPQRKRVILDALTADTLSEFNTALDKWYVNYQPPYAGGTEL
ncbi:MAG: tRNA-dihydrouridine synthase [Sedimentisphaerales bacterium]|nr:tRNA-dihydrouridine synthase [Sedimentisphaerales bacterium]